MCIQTYYMFESALQKRLHDFICLACFEALRAPSFIQSTFLISEDDVENVTHDATLSMYFFISEILGQCNLRESYRHLFLSS